MSEPGPPWLAVIDLQRVFAEPGSDWFTPRFGEITGPVATLARALAPRVVFTRFVAPAIPAGSWRPYYQRWPFALQPPGARLYELVPEFAGQAGSTVDATTFGKWQAGLRDRVPAGGTLVLAGVSTECCVLSTALAAADDGMNVQVAADACAGVSDQAHADALRVMALFGPLIEVVTVASVLGG